jgi:hypothetical protein
MQESQSQAGKDANHFEVKQSLPHAMTAHDLKRLPWPAPSPIKAMIARKDHSPLQKGAAVCYLSPHVETNLFPGVNWQPNSLQLHHLDQQQLCQFVQRPKPC